MDLFVEPIDRDSAISQCKNRLTIDQISEIRFAPNNALVRISYVDGQPNATVLVIPEG